VCAGGCEGRKCATATTRCYPPLFHPCTHTQSNPHDSPMAPFTKSPSPVIFFLFCGEPEASAGPDMSMAAGGIRPAQLVMCGRRVMECTSSIRAHHEVCLYWSSAWIANSVALATSCSLQARRINAVKQPHRAAPHADQHATHPARTPRRATLLFSTVFPTGGKLGTCLHAANLQTFKGQRETLRFWG
jgi:hypothetical protein